MVFPAADIKSEISHFFNNLSVITAFNHRELITIDKLTPRIYRIPKKIFPHVKNHEKSFNFTSLIENDYALLKKWKFLPDAQKITEYNNQNTAILSLRVSEDCNLKCRYCFNKENMLNRKGIKYMSLEIAQKAVVYFMKKFHNREKMIIFFGGEPLLNLPAIKKAIESTHKIKDKNVAFEIVTNGTIMNANILDTIKKNNIRIIVALDFPSLEHTRNRPFKNGRDSFKLIKENLILLAKHIPKNNLLIKSIFAKDSKFSPSDVYKSFCLSGIPSKNFVLSYDFTDSFDKNLLPATMNEKFKNLKNSFTKNYRHHLIIKKEPPIYKKEIIGDLLPVILIGRERSESCPAANNAIAVNPIGEIYFCDIVANLSEFYLGNLDRGIEGLKLKSILKDYRSIYAECSSCWANSFCHRFCHLLRRNKAVLHKNCAKLKRDFIKELKFFLNLDYRQKENLIQSTFSVIGKKKYIKQQSQNLKVCLAIHRMLNQTNKYIRPINILPY